jgi:capsular polysaccharide biosynthesis protein
MPLLRPIDELTALPRRATLAEFADSDAASGAIELLPASRKPASAWYRDCVAGKGGTPVPAWWNDDPTIESDAVFLFRVREAYYFPQWGAIVTPSGEVMWHSAAQARYLSLDWSALPFMQKRGAEVHFNPPSAPALDRAIVSMSLGAAANYGHFLCDCLSLIAMLSELPELSAYPYVFPSLQPWQRRHLELIGIESRFEQLDGPLYRLSDAIFVSSMYRYLHVPNVSYRRLRDLELANRIRGSRSAQHIYVSRAEVTKKSPLSRRFLSEDEVQKRLAALGFAILTPETNTVDEQIDFFRAADLVVGCSGAALANTLYCPPGATVVEIMPIVEGHEYVHWVRNICAINGHRWRPYFCQGQRWEPEMRHGQQHLGYSYAVDVDDLIEFIRRCT